MHLDLTNKVALVTGSAHRIGKAIAMALAAQGVHILVHYNTADPDSLRETMHDLKATGAQVHTIQADISQPDGVQKTMDALMEAYGRVDILINSASVFPSIPFLEITADNWDRTMNVNLRAPFLFTQACGRLMLQNEQPGGAIVNILDIGVQRPWLKRPDHGISKAALWSLTQVAALALAPHICVNGIVPGPVMKTNDGMTDATWSDMGRALPLQMTGEGADIGRAVVYLVSESFITGTMLQVNGGEHLKG